jgi:hypothetical protein
MQDLQAGFCGPTEHDDVRPRFGEGKRACLETGIGYKLKKTESSQRDEFDEIERPQVQIPTETQLLFTLQRSIQL